MLATVFSVMRVMSVTPGFKIVYLKTKPRHVMVHAIVCLVIIATMKANVYLEYMVKVMMIVLEITIVILVNV
jgi:hypothetical protein